jgi:hypothetical protein
MIVMPANSTGWFWHSLARETGRIGHLYSPRAQRGPWPWFPYALDNGAFSCWNPKDNSFDDDKWAATEIAWRHLLTWTQATQVKPLWSIVPDVPGNAGRTLEKWYKFAPEVIASGFTPALAVQDGMNQSDVPEDAEFICVGGSTEWKWKTVEMWAESFNRVHLLRCNSPDKLQYLEDLGIESTDGTGWNRGDRKQTSGLEEFARKSAKPTRSRLWPFVCRTNCPKQLVFA